MRIHSLKALLILFVGVLSSLQTAYAAQILAYTAPSGTRAVLLQGELMMGDEVELAKALEAAPTAHLFLNSMGGSAIAGLRIRDVLKAHKKLRVFTSLQGAVCASACAVAALGVDADRRYGQYQFHYPYIQANEGDLRREDLPVGSDTRLYLALVDFAFTQAFMDEPTIDAETIAQIRAASTDGHHAIAWNLGKPLPKELALAQVPKPTSDLAVEQEVVKTIKSEVEADLIN